MTGLEFGLELQRLGERLCRTCGKPLQLFSDYKTCSAECYNAGRKTRLKSIIPVGVSSKFIYDEETWNSM